MVPAIQIDGVPATVADLTYLALVNYGCFTSMQVRDGAVRGLDLHVARLHAWAVELFGEPVREARLRALMHQAIDGRDGGFSLRVNLFSDVISVRDTPAVLTPRVMVTLGPPATSPTTPLRVRLSPYSREAPHLKHVATFGLIRERRAALAAGFDDALFTTPDGVVSEGATWNIGFLRGDSVVWPLGPMLAGTGQALIQSGLDRMGAATATRRIAADDLSAFDGAFIVNSAIVAQPIASIGDVPFTVDSARTTRLTEAWASNRPDLI